MADARWASGHQKLAPISMGRRLPDGEWSLALLQLSAGLVKPEGISTISLTEPEGDQLKPRGLKNPPVADPGHLVRGGDFLGG